MRSNRHFSVTLPDDMAQMVETKVASGEYASESEVIHDGLRVLQERDQALERWLRTEVAAAYDAMKADPSSLVSSTDARARLAELHERRTKSRS